MKSKKMAQKYVNNFRREFSKYLKADIGLSSSVYLAKTGGAIVEFTLGNGLNNKDQFRGTSQNVGNALKNINQSTFTGNLNGFSFAGTNIILEPGRIILIKSDMPSEWSELAAVKDVERILSNGSANESR